YSDYEQELSLMYSIIFLSLASFLFCLFLTPLVRIGSERYGLVDRPNAKRKHHATPTPRTGGIAIALSYVAALGLMLLSPLNAADSVNIPFVLSLVPAAVLVFAIGLLDDVFGLPPWIKLAGQVLAAVFAYVG